MRRCVIGGALALAGLAATGCSHAVEESEWREHFDVEVVIERFERPWAVAFRPDRPREALLTERPGRLSRIDLEGAGQQSIGGLPEIAAVGQGGLLDVAYHPDYPDTEWIYFTYSAQGDAPGRYATHLARGRLAPGSQSLADVEVLHVATPFVSNTGHFGSRIVLDGQGYVYYTAGDRRDRDAAQDLERQHGKTLRLHEDGRIPDDNPFVERDDAQPAIYSYGHRNPQGLTLHPETGALWSHEHGERAGDEVNRIERGGNHGWPVATYGREYATGAEIGAFPHEHDGTVTPVYYWDDHAFPPSGMAFYAGDAFPQWRGALLLGALGREYLGYLTFDDPDDAGVAEEGALLTEQGWRVRDVAVRPDDGVVYLVVDADPGPLVRLVPGAR